ncbi:MAG: hypothetical protein ABI134_36160 [Byssovorax sp.]
MRKLFAIAVLMIAGCGMVAGCGSDGSTSTTGGSVNGERPVAELNGVPFGATCSSDSECGGAADSCCTGGKCSAAGWCSPKCQTDKDCPGGFFCIDHDGSRCFSACADDRDCPTDFICEDKNEHLTCRFKG